MSLTIKVARVVDKYLFGTIALLFGIILKIFPSREKPKKIKTVAFIKLWALGDSVVSLPFIKQIKDSNKKAKITIIAKKRNVAIYEEVKYVDEIILLETNNILQILKLFKRFDLVFDLEPYLNLSALLSWHIGKYRVGFSKQLRSMLYNETSLFSKKKHMVQIYLDLGKSFGSKKAEKLEKLNVSKKDKETVDKFLKKNKIKSSDLTIGICSGAAESVRERMWPKERYVKLCDDLIEKYKAKIIFIGSPSESEQIKSIQKLMKKNSINAAGKVNLKQTFNLIEKCKIFISNDTGPMHIAAAQGCKTIGLFGPNTPVRWGPYGKDNITIYHKQYCSPCIVNEKGIMPACVNKEFQKCMIEISIKEVESAVEKLIK